VSGFIILRKDHPEMPRPFRAGKTAMPLAVTLTVYGAVVLVVGSLSSELTGYGGPLELSIGVGILLLSLVLYVIRRRGQEQLPLLREPRRSEYPAADAPVSAPEPNN
jgi:amino acid transporter